MKKTLLAAAALALTLPMAAQAQGLLPGAQRGAEDGAAAAGPVGAIVGGAVGAATGAVGGLLGVDDRPRFRSYAVRQHRSYDWDGDVAVGTVLPSSGVSYYEVRPITASAAAATPWSTTASCWSIRAPAASCR